MEELNESLVTFNDEAHTYTLDGARLTGVTPIVEWMFPETYKEIPQYVLKKAAEHGTQVHKKCELYDNLGVGDDIQEVKDYIRLKEEQGLKTLKSEYLVDDGENIASSIDKVFCKDENCCYPLADIKTTSQLYDDKVALQLSIYAYLFELKNPNKKAGRLMCIWLPKRQYGEAMIKDIRRIPTEGCKEIVSAFLANEDSIPYRKKWFGTSLDRTEILPIEEALPENLREAEDEIIKIEIAVKELEKKKDALKTGLYELMVKNNVKKWESERLQLVRKFDTTREGLDSKKLAKKYPNIYEECKKVTRVKGSLMIKVL